MQENFGIHQLFIDWSDEVRDHDIHFSLFQGPSGCNRIDVENLKGETGISPGEPIDNAGNETHRDSDRSSNPHFSRRRIGEKFYVLDALPKLIERRSPSNDERAAIWSCLDPSFATIKKAHPECVFQVCNRS
jgi:hypothetical protein